MALTGSVSDFCITCCKTNGYNLAFSSRNETTFFPDSLLSRLKIFRLTNLGTDSIERNPFSAKSQAPFLNGVYISSIKYKAFSSVIQIEKNF